MNNTPNGDELLPCIFERGQVWKNPDDELMMVLTVRDASHARKVSYITEDGERGIFYDIDKAITDNIELVNTRIPATSATVGGEREEVVPGTREAIIHAVEQEMGYYDMPEEQPEISFTGKDVCELVDLAKRLMAENDELDDAAHVKSLEIIELKKQLRALATPQPARLDRPQGRLSDDEVEGLKNLYGEIEETAHQLFRMYKSGGPRGQMIRPHDGIEYWFMVATLSKLRERGII